LDVIEIGSKQEVDSDFPLASVSSSSLNVINIKPRSLESDYEFEVHQKEEKILCISGEIILEQQSLNSQEKNVVNFHAGKMAIVPIGVVHRWGHLSDGIVVVIF